MSASFSLEFIVDEIEVERDFSTRRNMKKDVLFPRYQGYVGRLDAPCAFVGTKEITPPSNLGIINLEDSIPENSATAFQSESQWIGTSYYSSFKYFLLTDITGDFAAKDSVPFYLKHILPSGNITPDSVAILDENLEEVNENSYRAIRIQARDESDNLIEDTYEECSVYSNYENSYNSLTGEDKLFFVRYEASGQTHYQLLNPQSAWTLASYSDISLITGMLKPWRKVYLLNLGTTYYTITTASSQTFFIKPLSRGRISLQPPILKDDTFPWFIKVSNGGFISLREEKTYSYSIPEFENQSFSPLKPYKLSEEEAIRLRPDILYVANDNLKVDTSFYIMEVLVKDHLGNVLFALTTNSSKEGEYYYEGTERVFRKLGSEEEWITWDSTGFASWDAYAGFLHLKEEYSNLYKFYVSYYYEETAYELTSLNLNPVFDEDYNGQFYVAYIVPTGGDNANTGSQISSLNWVKINRGGQIVDTSQTGDNGNFDLYSEFNTDGEYSYYSKTAFTTAFTSNPAGASSIWVTSVASFPSRGILEWIDTTGTRRIAGYSSKAIFHGSGRLYLTSQTLSAEISFGTTISLHSLKGLFSSDYSNNYQWLILGEVSSRNTMNIEELSLIDVREPGGVIKGENLSEAMALDPRSIWATSEVIPGRGQVIPGDTASIVKIPYTILVDYGGRFTPEQVETIVREGHLATGVVPAIIYHGAIPEIETLTSTTTTVTVTWHSEGSSYSYNIYYSSMRDGPWTLANLTPLGASSYENTYTITDLTPGLIYYVTVTSVDTEGIESPKSVVWGIKTLVS